MNRVDNPTAAAPHPSRKLKTGNKWWRLYKSNAWRGAQVRDGAEQGTVKEFGIDPWQAVEQQSRP